MSLIHCFLIKRKWMGYIVLTFSSCSLYALRHRFSQAPEGTRLGAISPVLGGNRRNRKLVSLFRKPTFNSLYDPFGALKRARDVTAPSRCSEPLRSKDGGPKRSSPCYAGYNRLTIACCSGGQLADWDCMAY